MTSSRIILSGEDARTFFNCASRPNIDNLLKRDNFLNEFIKETDFKVFGNSVSMTIPNSNNPEYTMCALISERNIEYRPCDVFLSETKKFAINIAYDTSYISENSVA